MNLRQCFQAYILLLLHHPPQWGESSDKLQWHSQDTPERKSALHVEQEENYLVDMLKLKTDMIPEF